MLDVLRALTPGEVVSYGDVAEDAGFPGRARAVGRILAVTAEPVPWWRVVTSNGRLVPGHEARQASRLRSEGVVVAGRSGRGRPRRPLPPARPRGPTSRMIRSSLDSAGRRGAFCALLDLDEGHADLGQGVAQRGHVRAQAGRRAPRRGRRRRRWPGRRRPGRAAAADRWMAASSYSPMAWLMTTTSAGTSATRARASSIWARSAASSTSSASSERSSSTSSGARPGRERSPPESSGSRRSPTGCSPPGVQRLLTAANLPGTTELQAGSRRPVRRQPPPGHPSEHLDHFDQQCDEGVRRVDARGAPAVADLSDRPRRQRAVRRRLGARRRHHRFPGGAAHCAGVIDHSHGQRAPDQRPHSRP